MRHRVYFRRECVRALRLSIRAKTWQLAITNRYFIVSVETAVRCGEIAAQSYQSYQVSESLINVGLHIRPLSVKSTDPGFLGKDSLFYWKKKLHVIVVHKTETIQPIWCS